MTVSNWIILFPNPTSCRFKQIISKKPTKLSTQRISVIKQPLYLLTLHSSLFLRVICLFISLRSKAPLQPNPKLHLIYIWIS